MSINPDQFFGPRQVAVLEGCSPTRVYKRLLAGEYEAIKDGPKTLISGRSILKRRERLPKAEFGARKGIRGVQPKVEASAP